jgi:hypothetical protein
MNREEHSLMDGAMAATTLLVGGGMITVIAAPFAIPILLFGVLLAVPLLPLALIVVPIALVRRLVR